MTSNGTQNKSMKSHQQIFPLWNKIFWHPIIRKLSVLKGNKHWNTLEKIQESVWKSFPQWHTTLTQPFFYLLPPWRFLHIFFHAIQFHSNGITFSLLISLPPFSYIISTEVLFSLLYHHFHLSIYLSRSSSPLCIFCTDFCSFILYLPLRST